MSIPAQTSGTTITAVVDNGNPQISQSSSLTVLEFPKAPSIETVYSNDTVVRGSGIPNAKIQTTIDGTVYEGITNTDGKYSIEIPRQSAGTLISVGTIDEFGTISELREATVQQANLAFESIPSQLVFEETMISSVPKTILREEEDWTIKVRDTRGPNSKWKLIAIADDFITILPDGSTHTLSDALVYKDSNGETHSLSESQVLFNGQTDEERIIPVNWRAEEGPLLEIIPSDAYAQQYSTTITWTLEDAP